MAIVEIGGTVGDIESLPFLEAIRQMRQELGRDNTVFVHVTLVPCIAAAQELKTKPTQHSVKEMLSIGIQPDILLCRTDRYLPQEHEVEDRALLQRRRRSRHHRERRGIIYEVPLVFAQEGVDALVLKYLRIDAQGRRPDAVGGARPPRLQPQGRSLDRHRRQVRASTKTATRSLKEALVHGALAHNLKLRVDWIEAEGLEPDEAAVRRS